MYEVPTTHSIEDIDMQVLSQPPLGSCNPPYVVHNDDKHTSFNAAAYLTYMLDTGLWAGSRSRKRRFSDLGNTVVSVRVGSGEG